MSSSSGAMMIMSDVWHYIPSIPTGGVLPAAAFHMPQHPRGVVYLVVASSHQILQISYKSSLWKKIQQWMLFFAARWIAGASKLSSNYHILLLLLYIIIRPLVYTATSSIYHSTLNAQHTTCCCISCIISPHTSYREEEEG